uniref:Lipid-A-disaccharide synthase n=1 Tax=Schlesneria paludicola TaxID=360056 RepID=A0A7C4LN46_9PLAN
MHVFFSVGEPSGDQHAALLIQELRRRRPELRVSGFGGPRMEQAGCQVLYPLTNLAVVGIFSVLPKLWEFYQLVRKARDYLRRHRPELVVVVDFPGFNWHIARAAKSLGIPVIYYLPPQLWAWAPWRIRKVRKYVDLVLSGLPFEAEWYAQRGVPVLYVGHPFFDEVLRHPLDTAFLKEWSPESGATVAVLPGSRNHEVQSCWPLLLEAVRRLSERHPDAQFLVANYKESQRRYCRELYHESRLKLPVSFFVGKTQEIIHLADCAMMVSGSVSLEMLARGTPATAVYRCGWPTYLIGRLLITCPYISLPNLIAGRKVMPEHVSVGDPEPVICELVRDVDRWLSSPSALDQSRTEFQAVRRQVHSVGASERAAEVILSRLPVAPQRQAA